MKEGEYTTILRQQCGKRRLEVVDQGLIKIMSVRKVG